MEANDKPVMVYGTAPSLEAAEAIGAALLDLKLAACINILPGMTSLYTWQGARQRESEAVLIIKTRAGLADRVVAEARARHPYTNPALVIVPILGGSADYLAWLVAETS